MTNMEAILKMDKEQLARLLDQVYMTGVHTGTYAASLEEHSPEQLYLLDESPYADRWLDEPAEEALLLPGEADGALPGPLLKAVLRNVGMEEA